MSFVTVRMPGAEPFRYSLRRTRVSIGRLSLNDLVLHDPTVSRRHAVIEHAEDGGASDGRSHEKGSGDHRSDTAPSSSLHLYAPCRSFCNVT